MTVKAMRFEPQLECKHQPNLDTMTRIGHRCILQPLSQWLLPDVRRDTRFLPKKHIFCPWFKRSPKPLLHRDHHPALWAFDDSIRQQPLHGIFQDSLLSAAIELQGCWDFKTRLDNPFVEQGRMCLNTCRIPDIADLCQNLICTFEPDIHPHQAVKKRLHHGRIIAQVRIEQLREFMYTRALNLRG